jgi:hypothetical protein
VPLVNHCLDRLDGGFAIHREFNGLLILHFAHRTRRCEW